LRKIYHMLFLYEHCWMEFATVHTVKTHIGFFIRHLIVVVATLRVGAAACIWLGTIACEMAWFRASVAVASATTTTTTTAATTTTEATSAAEAA